MLNGLTIRPMYGNPMNFSLPDASDGYLVKDIEGLGPVPVTLASSTQALRDGEVHQGSRREKRNIVLHIKLDLNYAGSSIESRRTRLLNLLTSQGSLDLDFDVSDGRQLTINGFVETVDTPLYTDDPVIVASIVCFDPDFVSQSEQHIEWFLTSSSPVTDGGTYNGTIPTGVEVGLLIPNTSGPGVSFEITQNQMDDPITGRVAVDRDYSSGNQHNWVLDSRPGQKRFWDLQNDRSIMQLVNFDTLVWPVLYPGPYTFRVAPQGSLTPPWTYSVTWRNRYGAI